MIQKTSGVFLNSSPTFPQLRPSKKCCFSESLAFRSFEKMSTTARGTSKFGGQSLFSHDLASPVSTLRAGGGSKFTTPGQAAAVSALWRENFANSDLLPPPPVN
ncbi:Nucleoporin nup35 [Sarracenia purpurea var. burkii]